ncbi:hypothetical protein HC028_20610 [Planosporangium flavigriseum]|uniref:Uncharacterized protein n=1 Tax=Planosporangium flavigriseum TaxID=373681 RepID=A0A8J3PNV1_9ACTN|nr:hypothetical protein [Planosporangium flavigriseum]NJC66890.1 hypothetical protein [Planosporangium flavigriseum]GIG74366.1 hypothetical protein Pfl04_27700 [Planosporangium flavigriseum]
MRGRTKTAKAVATWVVATGVGIGVTWYGVRPVLDAAVPERLVAFPAAGSKTPRQTPALRLPASPAPSTRSAGPSPGTPASRSPRPATRPAPPSSAASPPVPVPEGWTMTGSGQYVRTFRLTGGDATIRAAHGTVELVSAAPRPGYVMNVTPAGSDPLGVSFSMINRASKVEVSWVDNAPASKVTEIP